MAARDRFELTVTCPRCRKSGTARVSEDDYPFMRSPGFAIDELPDGFVETKYSEFRQETWVQCTTCKVPFHL
jgi:hypothetical protein